MELDIPDYATNLTNSVVALAKGLGNTDENIKILFGNLITSLNGMFSVVTHPFFENSQFAEMFFDWKSMYMRSKDKELLPEQQKINILLLAKLTENNVDKATAILENAIRYKFLDLQKSAEKMPEVVVKPVTNIALPSIQASPKIVELCSNPEEILAAHKFTITGKKIRCELVPAERAILLRSKLSGYTIAFTPNL